ncbi:DNA double-strand break repair rad50 ATPase [Schistosoma japonicum]|uniref:DNA double-strand break repair rad50 ATPase n=1 Tax=Schistosoma japonicum TaxID=6182 RepID=A0A4Z2DGP2_SCHJA|nr:DNA double-strand break repair rad50 ATPase [Schistosoma japonicum]
MDNFDNIPCEDFFSKFGQYELEREKKRKELLQDYLQYKQKEEANFYNRFSNKKKQCHQPQYSSVRMTATDKLGTESLCVQNTLPKGDLGHRLEELERKINSLLNDQSATANECSERLDLNDNSLVLNGESGATMKEIKKNVSLHNCDVENRYEEDLKRRLHQISEADKRLNLIEEEYNKLKNFQSAYTKDCSGQMHERFHNAPPTSEKSVKSELEYSKEYQKEKYRKELRSQITEAENRRSHEKMENKKDIGVCPIYSSMNKTSEALSDEKNSNLKNLSSTECLYFDIGQRDLLTIHTSDSVSPVKKFSDNNNKTNIPQMQNIEELKLKKMQYAEELRQQIEEAKAKKARQKKEDEEYNKKIEEQNLNLDISKENNLTQKNDSAFSNYKQISSKQNFKNLEVPREVNAEILAEITETVKPNFARGGHGIFGSPLTEEQKRNLQQYKKELVQQIAEKRHFMKLKKQKEIELEQRETERIQAEQAKMQKEFEIEQEQKQHKVGKDSHHYDDRPNEYEIKLKEHQSDVNTKVVGVKNTRYKRPLKNIESPKSSPKILIGPETSKINHFKQFSSEASDKHSSEKTQSILRQLNTLRMQLDMEKSKIESVYHQQKHGGGYEREYIEIGSYKQRSRPRVNVKAVELFQEVSNNTRNDVRRSAQEMNTHAQSNELENLFGRPYREDLSDINQKQIALLKKQDTYLQELKRELIQSTKNGNTAHLVKVKNSQDYNPTTIQSSVLDNDVMFNKPQNDSDVIQGSKTFSEKSIDLIKIAEKNKQRLLRLDAMQLLNEVSDDPESVLERFVNEHDEILSNEYKHNIF